MALTKRCRHARRARRRCGCAWYARVRVEGRERWINVGSDYPQARVAHARLLLEREEGRLVPSTHGPALAAVAERWLARLEADPDARANSIHTYHSRVRHIRRYFGTDVSVAGLSQRHVREFVADVLAAGARPATAAGIYAALRSVLVQAQEEGLIEHLPLPARSPVPRPAARDGWPGLADCNRVIALMREPWNIIAEICLLTGLRVGEAMALQADDVDLGRHELHVRRTQHRYRGTNAPKSAASVRVLPMSPRAAELLADVPERGPIWPGADYRRAYEALRDALDAAGIHRPGLGWHWFRNAHRTLLREAEVGLEDAARRMGHGANLPQTMRYGWHAGAGDGAALDAALARHDASRLAPREA